MLLIVDDEKDIQILGASVVERCFNLPVHKVGSMTEAKQFLAKHSPDFALLDLNLPDGSGFDLVPLLKAKNKEVVFAFITAFDQCKERNRAKELGSAGVLGKPFKSDELAQLIKEMLKVKQVENS